VIDKLFLCHHSKYADEINVLADELRMRGIVPWVDKEGGFSIADQNIDEARRAIREDCFGLLFYATRSAFGRDFITKVELPTALQCHDSDSSYVFAVVPRGISFSELSQLSIEHFGRDFAGFHSHGIPDLSGLPSPDLELQGHCRAVSTEVLEKRLKGMGAQHTGHVFELQFSTRDLLWAQPDDILTIDATRLLGTEPKAIRRPDNWQRLHEALKDVKRGISRCFGRPRIKVHGSKHLTAAFMFGHTFPTTAFELDIRTKHDYWSTDHSKAGDALLKVSNSSGNLTTSALFVEIELTGKSVRKGVDAYSKASRLVPFSYLRVSRGMALAQKDAIDNADACSIALQVLSLVTNLVDEQGITEIHMFAAVPQAVAMMLGHLWNALPPIQLYEFVNREYVPSIRLT
jgi:SMODS-associated and fused to various effectors sensor domain